MLGLFLLGYFSKKVKNIHAIIGVGIGLLVIIWMSISSIVLTGELSKYQNPLHDYLTIVVGTLVIFLVGFLLSTIPNLFKKTLR